VKLRLVVVGRGGVAWADAAVDDWARRLKRYGGIEETQIRPELFRGDIEAVRDAEAKRVLAEVSPRDRLVALDERGERLDTHQFASLVEQGMGAGGSLVLAIGGPYGHGPAVRAAAWRTLRLSDMVLNHEVARVVLYEQLYRAHTVLRGEPYHH
jgi:23S rRNA (pseudouridine1915-N3)-methyltransferase